MSDKIKELKEYRDHPALNYSLLSQVEKGEIKEFKGGF